MKHFTLTIALLSLGVMLAVTSAQDSQPASDYSADVESIDSTIAALYDVISGPPGPRDWDRFRNLFAEDGRLTATGLRADGSHVIRPMSPEDYVERSAAFLEENGFHEVEIARTLEQFGPIAHAFSTYETRREKDGELRGRGINSIQLVHDGERWAVLSIFWTNETDANPLPAKYLP